MSRPWDALVVGAGPAGALTATLLARAGGRIALIEKETFPRSKLCGGFVSPEAVLLLRSAGVQGPAGPSAENFSRIRTLCVTAPSGRTIQAPLPLPRGGPLQ